jgi:uncharacterized membrane protein
MNAKAKARAFLHREWFQVILAIGPLVAALVALPFVNHPVPMQWGLDGRVNWSAPSPWGLLVAPLLNLVAIGVIFLRERSDPSRWQEGEAGKLSAHGKATRFLRLAVSVIVAVAVAVQIRAALGQVVDAGRLIVCATGLLFAAMGNTFGKLKPNRYAGIRIPWTLNSETVWRRTHRFAGWIWTISGLILAVTAWFFQLRQVPGLLVGWLVLLIIPPLFVAWRAAREEARGRAAEAGAK